MRSDEIIQSCVTTLKERRGRPAPRRNFPRGQGGDEAAFRRITRAYEVLSDPDQVRPFEDEWGREERREQCQNRGLRRTPARAIETKLSGEV